MSDLEHPDVVAALRRIGASTPADRTLCPRCTSRWIGPDDDLCSSCATEVRDDTLARKRRWWNHRRATGTTAVQGAATWLKQELRKGPRATTVLYPRAIDAGIHPRILRRAAKDLEDADIIVRWRTGNGTDHRAMWALRRHATTDRDPRPVQSQPDDVTP